MGHFDDQNGAARRQWLADIRRERQRGPRRLTNALLIALGLVLVLFASVLFADGLTGEHYLGEAIRAARGAS